MTPTPLLPSPAPTDVELIRDYLKPKLAKSKDPLKSRIHCVNICDHNPEELTANYRPFLEKDWYFLTQRVPRKCGHVNQPEWIAGYGFWAPILAERQVLHNGVKIGTKNMLAFHDEQSKITDWLMIEYAEARSTSKDDKIQEMSMLEETVLCKIYKRKSRNFHSKMSNSHHHQKRKRNEFGTLNETGYQTVNNKAETSGQYEHDSHAKKMSESVERVKRTRRSMNMLEKSMSKLSLVKEIDDELVRMMEIMEVQESNKKEAQIPRINI